MQSVKRTMMNYHIMESKQETFLKNLVNTEVDKKTKKNNKNNKKKISSKMMNLNLSKCAI